LGVARTGLSFALLVVFTLAVAFPARADDVIQVYPDTPQPTAENGLETDETPSSWFVELTEPSTSDGGSAATVAASHDSFKSNAQAKGVTYEERFSYGDLWNGLSVKASGADATALRGLAGVKNVWPNMPVALPASIGDADSTIDLATAIQMTHADYVQNTLGFTGKGIKVGVIDTGIDYNNPDLGGCFSGGADQQGNNQGNNDGDDFRCRVFRGWDFVGDTYNADSTSLSYQPIPHPDPDPDDCNGHGTHVAGIVGANGVVKGVAPDVRFGAYRVFGCGGSTSSDIMLAAMERALADKMDVLNMSIGSAFQWPTYPTAVGADRLVTKHGMVVVASIGNNGPNGFFSAGAPGVGANVIGVASFDNTHVTLPTFTITGGTAVGYGQATESRPVPTMGSAPLARTGTPASTMDGCAASAAASLAGKIVLIRRGTCSFYVKAFNAQTAGAIGVVLYNNAPGFITPSIAGTPAVTIPVVMTSDTLGAAINAQIALGPTTLTWSAAIGSFPSPTGGLISSFSSYGLAPDLSFKPDIGAPGGNIYSTLPLEQGGHGSLSGTSMSSPHVAGAVALLLQADKKLRPPDVRDILLNSAVPHVWWGNPASGLLDNVQRQGAGMLDIQAAIERTAVVTPGKLALGESQTGPATRTLTLTNATKDELTFTFSHAPALSTGPGIFPNSAGQLQFLTGFAGVTFSPAGPIVVKKNKSATVNVTIAANAGLPDGSVYGGYLVATATGSGEPHIYRVPYAGFKGDYQAVQVLTGLRTAARQTAWTNVSGAIAPSFGNPAGHAFTMSPLPNPSGFGPATFPDVPSYLLHLNFQSSRATFTAYDSTGTTPLGEAMSLSFLPHNSTSTAFFSFAWDGFVGPAGSRTQLVNGEYVLKLTLVRALGDPNNPAHLETATFASVNIQRPALPAP